MGVKMNISNNTEMNEKIIFKKTFRFIFLISFISILKSCISYDKAIIYHKNYYPEKSNQLLFNGFYQSEKENYENYLSPIYFYADGSIIYTGLIKDTLELKKRIQLKPKGAWGFWGNYQISNDTITIETFPPNINTFRQERYLKKGVIKENKIIFYQSINRTGGIGKIDETINFINFKTKPDSTANWIRTKRKYNK